MQNEKDRDHVFCELEDQGVDSNQDWHSPEELEDDVEVLFIMMLGRG